MWMLVCNVQGVTLQKHVIRFLDWLQDASIASAKATILTQVLIALLTTSRRYKKVPEEGMTFTTTIPTIARHNNLKLKLTHLVLSSIS